MTDSLWIIGTEMLPIGRYPDKDIVDLATGAARGALVDAGQSMGDVDVLAVGCVNESQYMLAQRIQRQMGQTGIPAYNVVNACATGATAVRAVVMAIKAGEATMGLAIGCEQMGKMGLLGKAAKAQAEKKVFEPKGRYGHVLNIEGRLGTNLMPGVFAHAGLEYAKEHVGVGVEQFARIAEKNHAHSTLNPLAQYRKRFTMEEIMAAEMISWPNTSLMCSPTGDGAAAVVVTSGERLAAMSGEVRRRAVKISASVLTSDPFVDGGQVQADINTLTRLAADRAYEAAGVGPEDLDLVELHDCFATAELVHYDNLRLCEPGGAVDFFESGAPWRDGSTPVNVSGGLQSKGHPIAAT
ncbi:MAG: thiolase family protein, partial [Acidimicrobiia bacterium]